MDINKIRLYTTVYRFSRFVINIPTIKDGYSIDSAMIGNITIMKPYDTHLFPFFQVTVQIPQYVYREMQKSPEKLSASILWEYALVAEMDRSKPPAFKTYFSGNLQILMDDETPDIMENYKSEYEQNDGGKKFGMGLNDAAVVSFLLFNSNAYNGSMKFVNDILNGATLTDAIVYTLNQGGIDKVLMSPATGNKAIPSECVLKPAIVSDELQYLVDTYHLHKTGTVIFFDIDKGYILEKRPKCSAYTTNENKVTYLVSLGNSNNTNNLQHGCCIDNSEKFNLCNIPVGSIEIDNASISNEHAVGNNVVMVDTTTGKVSTATGGINTINGVTGVISIDSGNVNPDEVAARMNEMKNIIHLRTEGTHLEFLNPNKEFIISMDNTKYARYNGSYRITTLEVTFRRDGNYFIPVCAFTIAGGK